jgi:pimeloyl-ACP methyl ester carboxylesterase
LLDFLGIPRAHLLGCSQGSALALDYTLDHSERVLDLILESPGLGGYTPTGPIPGTIVELGEKLQEGDLTHAAELAVQIWLLGPIRSASQVDEVLQDRVFEMCRTALPNYFVAEDVLRPPAAERLDQIKRPTMLVAGDQDDPAILDITNLLASGITPSQKIILPGVGHLLNMETPHEFNRLAELFLREHPSPAHPVH